MKKILSLSAAVIIACNLAFPQGTAINKTGAAAHSSAMLDVSDTTKGILIPRMTKVNKLAISSPATGLMVYQTDDTTGFWYYDGVKWLQAIGPAGPTGPTGSGGTACSGAPPKPGPIIGNSIVSANTTYIYMVVSVAGATTYTWNYTGTGATISGNTNPVSIYFTPTATSGNLSVTASCGNGDSTSAAFPITVNPVAHGTVAFYYTGGMQTFQVPAGVFSVTVDLYGAQGQDNTRGGKGGQAKGTLQVLPFQNLYVFVGEQGLTPGMSNYAYNGGGRCLNGPGGGGGATDLRVGGTDISCRVIVAGGGGGPGYAGGPLTAGGVGGGLTGGTGSSNNGANGGSGGTQAAGGTGGTGPSGNGANGALWQGGNGGTDMGGGGGGGYYGGGGGGSVNWSWGGGGGGGSSYFAPGVTLITNTAGVKTGNGQAIITY